MARWSVCSLATMDPDGICLKKETIRKGSSFIIWREIPHLKADTYVFYREVTRGETAVSSTGCNWDTMGGEDASETRGVREFE